MAEQEPIRHRALRADQHCAVHTFDTSTGVVTEVYRTDRVLLEAPNWVSSSKLVVNGNGVLWTVDVDGGTLSELPLPGLPAVNNDHVPAPDGDTMYVSGHDGHIHRVSLSSGAHERVTADDPGRPVRHFLHGVSPDGTELAYVGVEPNQAGPWGPANIFTISSAGGPSRQLTFGERPADGPEYSPDGGWIYFNTEAFADTPGHAQIARMRCDGSELEQLTFDERVNWFPHLAPTGGAACYLSFPPGTLGHPENHQVELNVVLDGDWRSAEPVISLFGGQGTVNVNSWAPDGRSFAFVSYPIRR